MMERAVLICNGSGIGPEHLFLENMANDSNVKKKEPMEEKIAVKNNIEQGENVSTLYEMEKNMIFDTLNKFNWNKTKASKVLGISVRTMRNKLHEYGINDLSADE